MQFREGKFVVVVGGNLDKTRCIGIHIGSYSEKIIREDFDNITFSAKNLCKGNLIDVVVTVTGAVVTGTIVEYIPEQGSMYSISDGVRSLAMTYYDYLQSKKGVVDYIQKCQDKLANYQNAKAALKQSEQAEAAMQPIDSARACIEVQKIMAAMRTNNAFFGYPLQYREPRGKVVDIRVNALSTSNGLEICVVYPTVYQCAEAVFDRMASRRLYTNTLTQVRDRLCPLITTMDAHFTRDKGSIKVTAFDKVVRSLSDMRLVPKKDGMVSICYMLYFRLEFSRAVIPAQLLIDAMTYVCETLATGDVRTFVRT